MPNGDLHVIMGDFNAKIGAVIPDGVTGRNGLGSRNGAGDRKHDFCVPNNMIITNTVFKQSARRLYTWTTPDGKHRNQIDFILVNRRWRSIIHAARTLPGADCGSDHELLIAEMSIKLKNLRKEKGHIKYDLQNIPTSFGNEVRKMMALVDTQDRQPEELVMLVPSLNDQR